MKPPPWGSLPRRSVKLYPADQGDTTTLPTTLTSAEAKLAAVGAAPTADEPAELVTDKGYFGREVDASIYLANFALL